LLQALKSAAINLLKTCLFPGGFFENSEGKNPLKNAFFSMEKYLIFFFSKVVRRRQKGLFLTVLKSKNERSKRQNPY
jgi:hypothetical protein